MGALDYRAGHCSIRLCRPSFQVQLWSSSGQPLWPLTHPYHGSHLGIWWLCPQSNVSPVQFPYTRFQSADQLRDCTLHTPLLFWGLRRREIQVYTQAIKITALTYPALRIPCHHLKYFSQPSPRKAHTRRPGPSQGKSMFLLAH